MKTKHILITYLIIVGILILDGFQLANSSNQEDRPVGMIITADHIGTFADAQEPSEKTYSSAEAAFQAALSEEPRIYATKKEELHDGSDGKKHKDVVYKFEQEQVIAYFYNIFLPSEDEEDPSPYQVSYSENVVDLKGHYNEIDHSGSAQEHSSKMDAMVYFPTKGKGSTLEYTLGYIYQQPDGRIYATSGNAFQLEVDHATNGGFGHSTSFGSTVNIGDKTIKESLSLSLSTKVIDPPEKYRLLQLDREMKILSSEEYGPGKLPEEISPEKNAVCVILQSFSTDADGKEIISLEIADQTKEMIDAFYCKEQVCEKQSIALNWSDKQYGY